MKEIHDTQPKNAQTSEEKFVHFLVECREPIVNNAQNKQYKF
jgi:hypothetical protein